MTCQPRNASWGSHPSMGTRLQLQRLEARVVRRACAGGAQVEQSTRSTNRSFKKLVVAGQGPGGHLHCHLLAARRAGLHRAPHAGAH